MLPDLPWFVYAMLLAPLGLILAAAVYKSLQVRAAREWPSAAGKVVVSKAEVRKVKVIDGDREEGHRFEERNFADIVYEYSVAGRKLRNNRVSIGEDLGNFQVAETIAKYPVGAVVTVYYNPRHPDQAVLERDLPKGMWGCLGIGTGIVLAIVFGSAVGLHQITEFVSSRLPQHGNSAAAVAFGAFGTAVALFALLVHRQASLGDEMACCNRHHQAFRHRAIPRRAEGRIVAWSDHVPAQGVLHLHLQQYLLHQCPSPPRQQRRVDVELAGAQVDDRLPERCHREGLGQPRDPFRRRRSNRARVLCGCCGSPLQRYGAWRITPQSMARAFSSESLPRT